MLNNDDVNPLTFDNLPVKDTLTLNANRITNIG